MEKIRIYQLAKELNTTSKVLIEKLKAINIFAKNHMSLLEEHELTAIYDYFGVNIKSIKNQEEPSSKEEPLNDEVKINKEDSKSLTASNPEAPKTKKNAPRIIRTEVREIRTDINTGITTEIRTRIKGDSSKREVSTNIINTKIETPDLNKSNFFEFKNTDTRKKTYDSKRKPYDNLFKNDIISEPKAETEPVKSTEEKQKKPKISTQPENKPNTAEKGKETLQAESQAGYVKKRFETKEDTRSKPYNPQQNRPYNNTQQNRPYNNSQQNRPYNAQNRNTNKFGEKPSSNIQKESETNKFNKPLKRDFIGEQLREVSKDLPKQPVKDGQKYNRDTFTNKDKAKINKKEAVKPVKSLGKQDRNINSKAIKTIGHEQKVSDVLNNDEMLMEFYDSDQAPRKLKKGFQPKSKKPDQRVLTPVEPVKVVLKVTLPELITVKDLGERLKKQSAEIIKKLFSFGVMATLNQDIDYDTAAIVAEEFGYTVEKEIVVSEEDILFDDSEDKLEDTESRAPIAVVMGHVDHGKTSLLDAIRETNVMAKEAGGITQHIGAYSVKINNRRIAFLDTPGHEAFTAMRARGAQVTDIAILVVAADDGVMPQTIEAINHAKAANVSIIVAVNKIDKPGADPDRVKQELMNHGLVPEEWGGDTICVNVSAKKREGIDTLLEMVLLAADMLDLRSNPNKQAKGTVIEAKLDKGRGPVATVLVQRGTLNVGDSIVTGTVVGRIRAMNDDKGQKVKKAKPSTPVEIIGLPDVPEAGEIFYAVKDEKIAKQLAEKRKIKQREHSLKASSKVTLDDLFNQIQEGKVKDLNIIVKADVQGSVEAVKQSLEKISNEEVRVKIIHGGVGAVTESDVMLANVSNAIIIGFNIRPEASAKTMAERENVDIKLYRVIYEAIDDITAAMKGLLDPKFKEVILGHAEIRKIFKASEIGTIAGSYITDGKISRNSDIRLIRDSIVIHEGKISSLKRFKDDVKEALTGFECGITLEKFNDLKEGDIIEAYMMEKIAVD